MQTQQIRRKFLNYFKEKQHTIVPSSPVAPHDDPTLLFINAGMNQFKDVFLGRSNRDYSRAVSSQKCIRVGGKHNDLDNVGHTSRHLTFFEMLGNFSFGDYFKKEAIQFAWEASTEIFNFPPEKLWATVFRTDDEAFELWKAYLPENRIVRMDEKDNFWAMGDTGPCGPCSELYYDRGEKYSSAQHIYDDVEGERYLEFWNLVFMQSNRDANGKLSPLPKQSIDTGAGLERVMSLMADVPHLFATDVLRSIIAQVEQVSGVKYDPADEQLAPAFHVIADHLRSLSFAIADGVQPSNVDRGYVLRKILRRAVRYGRMLGVDKPFLSQVFPRVLETMGEDYPELHSAQSRIEELLTTEEESFLRTLRRGGNLLNQITEDAHRHGSRISGDDAFKLKDTYGFPFEEILLIAKDSALHVDVDRFEELEEQAKERSRRSHKTTKQLTDDNLFDGFEKSEFVGYTEESSQSKVTAIVADGQFIEELSEGQEGWIILDRTPFYAEMGGQVGDTGFLENSSALFDVKETQSPYSGVIAQQGALKKGVIRKGDLLTATIDSQRRRKIGNNHTVTHLLHWALHEVLGEHIRQAGSVVAPDHLRFDFSHHKALSDVEVRQIEDLVNEKIRENRAVKAYETEYAQVQESQDIKQFFGEKYGKTVRVIDIDYSKELCGGTHTSAVGNIGLFRISKEGSIAAGIRRIEALTGAEAESFSRKSEDQLNAFAEKLKTHPNKLPDRFNSLVEENETLKKQLLEVKKGRQTELVTTLRAKVSLIKGIPVLASEVPLQTSELRPFANQMMDSIKSGVLVLGAVNAGKCNIVAKVSPDMLDKGVKANEIIKSIAPIVDGTGGGKVDMAQAGGTNPGKLSEALEQTRKFIEVM